MKMKMKKSGILAASLAAASATAVSATASASASFTLNTRSPPNQEEGSSIGREESADKFAPRFDGLKFIETLVTAHR